MSMILDALSRAEQERRSENGVVPDPTRYVGSSSIKEERLKKWILIALLVNIALVVLILANFLWKEKEPDNSAQVAQTAPPNQSVVVAKQAVPIISPKIINEPLEKPLVNQSLSQTGSQQSQEPTLSLQEEARVNKEASKPVVTKKRVASIIKKNPPVRYASQPLSKPDTGTSIPKDIASPTKAEVNNYTSLSNLSPADRSALNQYEINVHVYDKSSQNRFVLINMTKYKEGDRLSGGGPLITAITPEGVILDTGSGRTLLERN